MPGASVLHLSPVVGSLLLVSQRVDKLQNPILNFTFSFAPGTMRLRLGFLGNKTLRQRFIYRKFIWVWSREQYLRGSERSRFGKKEKISYNTVTAKASANLMGDWHGNDLQSNSKLRQRG